jgi:hypothetical protein
MSWSFEKLQERANKNLRCPRCGVHTISARERILASFTLSRRCVQCGCVYGNPSVVNKCSGLSGAFLSGFFLDNLGETFDDMIPAPYAIPYGLFSTIAVIFISLLLTSIVFGTIGLYIYPLEEDRDKSTDNPS